MAFGSQIVGDVVVLKFDMHVYTSILTFDEVKNLVGEYAIPLDLHPCVPPFGLTMNRLLADKIGIYDQYLELSGVRVPFSTFLLSVIKHFRVHISQLVPLGLNQLTMFEIYCRSLEINPFFNLFRAFYKLNKQGHWFSFERRSGKGGQSKILNEFCTSLKHWKDRFFLIDRRVIPDAMPWRHQDSSVADPAPTGVRTEDVCRLCKNVIDLHPVHPTMLYAIGLMTIWKHVGHHSVFKDGEGTGNIILLPILEKSDHQKVVEYENERVLAAKRKAQAAKNRVIRKRAATEGASQHTKKKKKIAPLSFTLLDSEVDGSNRSGSGTHHSASPFNTIIPNEAELTTRGDDLILEPVNQAKKDTDRHLDNMEDTTEVNSLLSEHSPRSQHSNPSDEDTHNTRGETAHTHASCSTVSSSSGGSHRQVFPRRNRGGRGISSSLRGDMDLHVPFIPAWNLTTHSILNDVESCRDMMINLATPAVRDQHNRLSDYQALQRSWFELGRGALAQIDILWWYEALNEDYGELYDWNQLSEDHKALQQVHLGYVGKEADLTEKLVAVEKERDDLMDRDREREERIKKLEADLASKTSSLTEAEGVKLGLKDFKIFLELLLLRVTAAQLQLLSDYYCWKDYADRDEIKDLSEKR
ncbi:hypothetical protein Tco_0304194 [Tanacetum coccineum]